MTLTNLTAVRFHYHHLRSIARPTIANLSMQSWKKKYGKRHQWHRRKCAHGNSVCKAIFNAKIVKQLHLCISQRKCSKQQKKRLKIVVFSIQNKRTTNGIPFSIRPLWLLWWLQQQKMVKKKRRRWKEEERKKERSKQSSRNKIYARIKETKRIPTEWIVEIYGILVTIEGAYKWEKRRFKEANLKSEAHTKRNCNWN